MEKCYAIMLQKGGVGKSTTAVALASGLAQRGKKTLLVDLDQQGDSTFLSNLAPELINYYVRDVIIKICDPKDAIQKTEAGYDIMPTTEGGLAELTLEPKLKVPVQKIISLIKDDYDYVVIDCPPNIYNITVDALIAADEIICVGNPSALATRGLQKTLNTINDIKTMRNKKLKMAGLLITMYDGTRTELNAAAEADYLFLSEKYGFKIFGNKIPQSVTIEKTGFRHDTLYEHIKENKSKANAAIVAYDQWVTELTGIKREDGGKNNGGTKTKIREQPRQRQRDWKQPRRRGNPQNRQRAARKKN